MPKYGIPLLYYFISLSAAPKCGVRAGHMNSQEPGLNHFMSGSCLPAQRDPEKDYTCIKKICTEVLNQPSKNYTADS